MIHKYNNTHGNKMININHPIHEQNIYDKIIVLLTSRLLQTNNLPLKLGANHRRPYLYTKLYILKDLIDLEKISQPIFYVSQTHRSVKHLVLGLRKRFCEWISYVSDCVNFCKLLHHLDLNYIFYN